MVGQGVLRECLLDPGVTEVFTVGRSATGRKDPKLREIIHRDFTDFSNLNVDGDACFWCLGVTSLGMSEADYAHITHDYTLAAARVLARPTMTFVFVSGTGADGDAMWARVKRRTEEDLAALPFKDLYIFRPGLIVPLNGIRSRTRIYNILYPILYPLMMLVRKISPDSMTDTERVGKAMLTVARKGFHRKILESADMNEAALG
jgi:uncharacterized protein YbjT (DUF2867 family)